jgi:hypothetical protein
MAVALASAGMPAIIADQTFMKGASGTLKAIDDPINALDPLIANTAGSIVPSAISAVARAGDIYKREVKNPNPLKTIRNTMQARVPGLRNYLPTAYNVLGQPKKEQEEGIMTDILRSSPEINKNDKTVQELSRLSQDKDLIATPSPINQKQNILKKDFTIPTRDLSEIKHKVGVEVKNAYDRFVNMPYYNKMNDEDRSYMFTKIYRDIKHAETVKYAERKGILTRGESLLALWNMIPPSLRNNPQGKSIPTELVYYKTGKYVINPISASRMIKAKIKAIE